MAAEFIEPTSRGRITLIVLDSVAVIWFLTISPVLDFIHVHDYELLLEGLLYL